MTFYDHIRFVQNNLPIYCIANKSLLSHLLKKNNTKYNENRPFMANMEIDFIHFLKHFECIGLRYRFSINLNNMGLMGLTQRKQNNIGQ